MTFSDKNPTDLASLTAVTSSLTGRTVMLPAAEVAPYEQLVAALAAEHSPVGVMEKTLVQAIADAKWRLKRLPVLEFGIHAEAERAGLIREQTEVAYQKQLKTLKLLEKTTRRHLKNDLAELKELQVRRRQNRKRQLAEATASLIKAYETGSLHKWDPSEFADFTNAEIYFSLNRTRPDLFEPLRKVLRWKLAEVATKARQTPT